MVTYGDIFGFLSKEEMMLAFSIQGGVKGEV